MGWEILTILAMLLYGVVYFYRKIACHNVPVETACLIEVASLTAVSLLALVYLLLSGSMIIWSVWRLTIISGCLNTVGLVFLYRSLKTGPASLISVIVNLSALVTAPLGFLLLGETLTFKIGVGVLLALLSIVLLIPRKEFSLGSWSANALVTMVSFGVFNYVNKLISISTLPIAGFAMTSTCSLLSLLIYLRWTKIEIELPSKRKTLNFFVIGTLLAIAFFLTVEAYSKAPVSIVQPIANLAMLVTVILAAVFLKEKLTLPKIAAVFVAAFSVWLLTS